MNKKKFDVGRITITTTTDEGINQRKLGSHGSLFSKSLLFIRARISPVGETSISSKGVYVSGCWSLLLLRVPYFGSQNRRFDAASSQGD